MLDVLRSVPLLIQLILANAFQSIAGLGWSPFLVACVVLSLYTSAYCAEIVRGGIDAVPAVTRRAARSLGMTWGQDMTNVDPADGAARGAARLDRPDARA